MKKEILQKASELFFKLGFKSVTMDDISRAMGMSKKTLYKYYSKKEVLVAESARQFNDVCVQKINEVKVGDFSAIQEHFEVKNMLKEISKNIGESPMYQLKKYYADIYKEIIDTEFKVFQDVIRDNIKKGIEEGVYRKNIDIHMCASFYFNLSISISEMNHSQANVLKIEGEALEYHLRAISSPKGINQLESLLKKIKVNG